MTVRNALAAAIATCLIATIGALPTADAATAPAGGVASITDARGDVRVTYRSKYNHMIDLRKVSVDTRGARVALFLTVKDWNPAFHDKFHMVRQNFNFSLKTNTDAYTVFVRSYGDISQSFNMYRYERGRWVRLRSCRLSGGNLYAGETMRLIADKSCFGGSRITWLGAATTQGQALKSDYRFSTYARDDAGASVNVRINR